MADKHVITKVDLADALAKGGRLPKGEALNDVELIFEEIAKALLDGSVDAVKIAGFGTFSVADRPERTGVNPSDSNQKITIPASKAVKFKPSKTLKDLVNDKK